MRSLWLLLMVFSSYVYGLDPKTYIPKNAYAVFPLIQEQSQQYFPVEGINPYAMALMEQESCISLTHSRCFLSTAELRTSREFGAGLPQITKAYNPDGSIRFDKLAEMKASYKQELKDLSWENIKLRPDLQVRVVVLMIKDLYNKFYFIKDPEIRYHFVDPAYNGGPGGVMKERTACGLAKDCDPNIWFGNVERYCLKSKRPLPAYGGQSICDINRKHPSNVFKIRIMKYKNYFEKQGVRDVSK